MRWVGKVIASSLLAFALVAGGFCSSAVQGGQARSMVEDAYAVGEVQAARAFATLLGTMGFSVGAYALKNSTSFDASADALYLDFQAKTTDDAIKGIITSACSAIAASPAGVAFANLGITVAALQSLAQWMIDESYLSASSITYPPLVVSSGSNTFSYPVSSYSSPNGFPEDTTLIGSVPFKAFASSYYSNFPIPYFYYLPSDAKCTFSFSQYKIFVQLYSDTTPALVDSKYVFVREFYRKNSELKYLDSSVNAADFSSTPSRVLFSFGINMSSSYYLTPFAASMIDSSYSSVGSGVTAPSDTAVADVPANIGASSTAADTQAFADAVSANLADKTLVANGTTITNYNYGDIVTDGTVAPPADNILDWLQENLGALQGTLEGVLEGIQAQTLELVEALQGVQAGVLEGVQTFFDPVVKLFTPPDVSDDDIGDMIKINASGSHTFTTKFPFCVLSDYMAVFDSLAVDRQSRAALNYTPAKFVITIPAAGYSGGKDVKMDFTHYFSDEFYGFTLGRFSQLVLSVCTFIAILSFVARLVGIADLPSNFYANAEGGVSPVYEDDDGQTRLF